MLAAPMQLLTQRIPSLSAWDPLLASLVLNHTPRSLTIEQLIIYLPSSLDLKQKSESISRRVADARLSVCKAFICPGTIGLANLPTCAELMLFMQCG